jgi:hypothetical protein
VTPSAASYYEPLEGGRFRATAATVGPWTEHAQHGGPPAALLGRALESLEDGPLRQAELSDESGRVVARAQAWAFPGGAGWDGSGPGGFGVPLEHGPSDGRHEEPPASWSRGYLDSVDWLWISGAVTRPGPAVVWMRPRTRLVPDEELSPLQRLLACVDSASGASAELDVSEWNFMNTDLTVHVVRPPVGEWLCLHAETTLGPGSVGVAAAEVYDERGLVARSAQALLVTPRK